MEIDDLAEGESNDVKWEKKMEDYVSFPDQITEGKAPISIYNKKYNFKGHDTICGFHLS